jgi:hypothetical protein
MKINKTLLVVVLILSLVTAFLLINRQMGTVKGDFSNFAIEDTASIDKIFIVDKAGKEVLLEKSMPGVWMVNKRFEARNDMVKNLLDALKRMDVRAPVPQSMLESVIKDLATNFQRKVEVYANGKRVKVFYVGSDSMDHHGTFMLLENSTTPYEMHIPGFRGYLSIRFVTDERLWKKPIVFSYPVQEIRKVRVEYTELPQESFEVTHDGNGAVKVLSLQSNQQVKADSAAALDYLIQFGKISYEAEVALDFPKRDSILNASPWVRIEVTTADGSVNKVRCVRREPMEKYADLPQAPRFDPDRMYAVINEGKDLVLVQYFVFNRILVPLVYFTQEFD